ncbi:uncharacterized protein LOC100875687 isoform X2 [Megachile rotundata]|uniref:uncharacterized protein LOC100875687 isoform X2 n=1 Tax=Megachile rotundata TaxID=143995 RepID=UPI000614C132|nr:PREDICTED: uncharacterized protein LOC100875687 isoform X2 [Megachile rotundata]
MSRPILSRPRTRVYGCNYDKGESYYKPMVDHLDRKYSGRPLFSEPRTSLADEIAARRNDIGSRNLSGNRNDYYDDLDYIYAGDIQDDIEDDFVLSQRRQRERAAAAFAEDLADLRRKRRDMQDRIFDVIDLNAEIEKAKNTLEAADVAFQRHATKFDNTYDYDDMSSRKVLSVDMVPEKTSSKSIKFIKVPNVDMESCIPQSITPRHDRINSLIESAEDANPMNTLALQPLKRKFLKRKKNVSF